MDIFNVSDLDMRYIFVENIEKTKSKFKDDVPTLKIAMEDVHHQNQ